MGSHAAAPAELGSSTANTESVGVAVVDEFVQIVADKLLGRVSQHSGAGLVDECHLASRSMPKMPSSTASRINSRCRVAMCSASSASYCSSHPCRDSAQMAVRQAVACAGCARRCAGTRHRSAATAMHPATLRALQRVQAILNAAAPSRRTAPSQSPHQGLGAISERLGCERVQRGQPPSIEHVKTNPRLFSTTRDNGLRS